MNALIKKLKRLRTRYRRLVRCVLSDTVNVHGAPPLSDELAASLSPVFVLSTGRCGTKWLTELLSKSSQVFVNHSLQPELVRQSRRAYELWAADTGQLQEIVRATRDDLLCAAHKSGLIYVETNNRMTFFARAIAQVYPHSQFIHLYRHPGDFVRSGMRRDWYLDHSHDIGRIVMDDSEQWQNMSRLERIAWLWNETNDFIEQFFKPLAPDRQMSVKSERMFDDVSVVIKICDFIGIKDIVQADIQAMLGKRVNVQKKGEFPKYEDWSVEQKEALQRWCTLSLKYEYDLGA